MNLFAPVEMTVGRWQPRYCYRCGCHAVTIERRSGGRHVRVHRGPGVKSYRVTNRGYLCQACADAERPALCANCMGNGWIRLTVDVFDEYRGLEQTLDEETTEYECLTCKGTGFIEPKAKSKKESANGRIQESETPTDRAEGGSIRPSG